MLLLLLLPPPQFRGEGGRMIYAFVKGRDTESWGTAALTIGPDRRRVRVKKMRKGKRIKEKEKEKE